MLANDLPQRAIGYLNQVLGEAAVRMEQGASAADLPYFLQEAYEVVPSILLGHSVALACIRGQQTLPAQQIDRHVRQLQDQLQMPVIVALSQVSAGERKLLIAQDLAFVVPGSQLYAPRLGIVLSERFPVQAHRELTQMSPATQALLIWFLLHYPVTETWQPSVDAVTLGYTAMTATRAARELLQFRLFELEVRGRSKYLKLQMTRQELWEMAKPHLTTPVQRTLWTFDQRILQMRDVRAAGERALSRFSSLNEPEVPVVAATSDVLANARQDGVIFESRKVGGAIEVQVWRYPATMEAAHPTGDRLSIWLSLRDSKDPRIQIALDELEKGFPW